MADIKTIGILTGGGDCPGLNAVVRAATKTAIKWGWKVIGFRDGYAGLVEDRFIELDSNSVSGILTRGGTILGTSNTANPFAYTIPPLGTPDAPTDMSQRTAEVIAKHKLDALIAIGGDGTLSIGLKLIEMGLPVVGVPKTIDNDLAATDVTFGFDSALAVATDALDKLHTTAESHHRVMILETMGRYAGWIALRSGIAGGGDVILLPEIPYSDEEICNAVRERKSRGKNFSIIVAAEGAKPIGGEMSVARVVKGSPDPLRLGGIAYKIADQIEQHCGVSTRVVVLGHLQRGGTPTAFDRWLATRFGYHAAELIRDGKTGHMTALRGMDIVAVPIKSAVQNLRRVETTCEELQVALGTGVSFGNKDYK